MLPFADIHFVACGIATFAATVGYNFARKHVSRPPLQSPAFDTRDEKDRRRALRAAMRSRSGSPSDSSVETSWSSVDSRASSSGSDSTCEQTTTDNEPVSLKRKSIDDDDASEPGPKKRNRAPLMEKDETMTVPVEELHSVDTETPSIPPPLEQDDYVLIPSSGEVLDKTEDATESETVGGQAVVMSSPPTLPTSAPPLVRGHTPTPPSSKLMTYCDMKSPSRGFAAFAGTSSAFSLNGDSQPISCPNEQRAAWCSSTGATASHGGTPLQTFKGKEKDQLDPLGTRTDTKTTYTHLTGEEDEESKLDIKGVKLFVKRGSKDFSDGMIGQVKLLAHRSTHEERLVFRREPLWKVSMNVRIRPTIRCTFDREEHVLRLVLKEPVEQADVLPENWPLELVVYALKPGRAPKGAFREFADALLQNQHLSNAAN